MSAVSWRRQNIKEGMITWHGIFTGNVVVNVDWKELIAGMNRSRREWWKVRTSRFCDHQCDRKIGARRPDIVFIDMKEREVGIIGVAIPGDDRVKDKSGACKKVIVVPLEPY